VEFIAKTVPLKLEHEILDLGCGFGRHSLGLASMGFRVTGLDQSGDYLAEARQAARDRNLAIRFIQGDMRQLDFR
jgi:2-polyprenyl-3-methyl-5-hydroxy-6-metoxy-1,4-benzoquinol methylase